jgi:ABC-type multidrug transport system ATPase subunit
MSQALLEVDSLSAGYGAALFRDLSLNIQEGEFVTLMGENGAGKTTLLECLLGSQKPLRGSIRFFGKSVQEWSRQELHRQVTWVLAYSESLPPALKVGALLEAVSQLYPSWDHSLEGKLLTDFKLARTMIANRLSLGERAKLKLVRALCPRPRLLICDELTANLSPESKKHVTRTLIDLLGESKTSILYSCHSPDEAVRLSDRIFTLTDQGLAEGPLTESDSREG